MPCKKLTASGKLALASGDAQDRMTKITGIQLAGGSDSANVVGYMAGAATAGTEFMELTAAANTEREFFPPEPMGSPNGWYFALSGTAVALFVYYE